MKRYNFLFLMVSLLAFGCSDTRQRKSDKEDKLAGFELEEGFKIELVASEPLVADPVDMEIDEYGRLYVVEMHGYPLDKNGSGKIKLLSDTNADGRMDKMVIFAEGLMLPNSVMRWKNGVLVTDAPNVLYFEDSNGDGVADIKDTLLTGFALSNPQHNLNSPLLGLDNWIYLAHEGAVTPAVYKTEFGDIGTDVYYPASPSSPRLPPNAGGRSVRFQPDKRALEMTSSITQFGHSFDTWGNHFLVSNANHILQEVIAAEYLQRNPSLIVSDATESLSDHLDAAEVFPITQNPERQLLTDVGVITSACGITAYTGGAFPPSYDSITFVAEPVSNLVHADRLTNKGTSFTASRLHANKEFLASTDAWFRPVNMYIGPDGALYVVDYYRQIIEHPEWMGEEVVKSGKLYNGMDKGRIYRITPTEAKSASWTSGLTLGDASADQLVAYLSHPNRWWRQNAQRLLIDRADKKALPALAAMIRNESFLGRLHALWTLEGMGALRPAQIVQSLKDPVPGIRENAIRLAGLHVNEFPELIAALLPMVNDPEIKVRYQLLCTIGSVNTPESIRAQHTLLFKDISDKWMQIAALSSSTAQKSPLLQATLDSFRTDVPAYASLIRRLTAMVGSGSDEGAIKALIQKAAAANQTAQNGWQASALEGLAQGLQRKRSVFVFLEKEQGALVNTFFENPSEELRKAALQVLQVTGIHNKALAKTAVERAAAVAVDPGAKEGKRTEAIQFIALKDPSPYSETLKKLIDPREQLSVQFAALKTLGAIPDLTVCRYILQQWPELTPELRDAAASSFLNSPERITLLLDALESGKVRKSDLGWPRSVDLMSYPDEALRNRARALLTKDNAETERVNKEYQAALKLTGDLAKGKEVYMKNCAICHQVKGKMGINFGPDLGTIHNWLPSAIMANVLAPDLSISSGYDLWSVELKNGTTTQGIIASETPAAILLRNSGKADQLINREDIKILKALNMSAMTSGLEKQIGQQQMADLLAFLRQN